MAVRNKKGQPKARPQQYKEEVQCEGSVKQGEARRADRQTRRPLGGARLEPHAGALPE